MPTNKSRRSARPDMMLLDCIKEYILKHGYAPSVREMCEMSGIKSSATVHSKLVTLMEEGYIESDFEDPGIPRAIRVKGLKTVEVEAGMLQEMELGKGNGIAEI